MDETTTPKGRKRGPKTELPGERMHNRQMTIDDKTERLLKVVGGGNLSRGVREAARFTYEAYQKGRFEPPKT